MPKTKISEFDVNPANNTDINSINIAEGCAPSGINNAIRQLMSDLKEFQTGAGGDPFNGAVNGTVGATTPASGAFTTLSASGAFSANGGATLGDASGDALTINSSAVSIPNGLNFGSNNLVLSSGNVGIGTSSPVSIAGYTIQTLNNATTGSGVYLQSAGTDRGRFLVTSTAAFVGARNGLPLVFEANATEAMRIDSSGQLGIGTSSPGYRLDVAAGDTTAGLGYAARLRSNSTAGAATLQFTNNAVTNQNAYITADDSQNLTLASGTGYARLWTNGSERMRIDSSGNVGIGTSSPTEKLSVNGGIVSTFAANLSSGAGAYLYYTSGTSSAELTALNPGVAWLNQTYKALSHQFSISGTERMRIDSSGNLLVGCTSAPSSTVKGTRITADYSSNANFISVGNTTAGTSVFAFFNGNGVVGSISLTGSTTAYSTSSDYRLKHDITPMTGALAKVQQLKPVTYKWNSDDSTSQGFIAHELQAVVPDCVTGEKDAVDAEGKPVYQGIDTSFLVAILTAAIQEQQAIITELKTRIEALESK